jgi:hypothetical protein
MCRIVLKNMEASIFWNPQGLSRTLMGLLYLYRLYMLTVCAIKLFKKNRSPPTAATCFFRMAIGKKRQMYTPLYLGFLRFYYYTGWSKYVCTWWLQHKKLQVIFKLYPALLLALVWPATVRQGQGDARLTLTPSVIRNFKYVIIVSDWNCLKYLCVLFLYCNYQMDRDFLSCCVFVLFVHIYICTNSIG